MRQPLSASSLLLFRTGPPKMIFVKCSLSYTLPSLMAFPSPTTPVLMEYATWSHILRGMVSSLILVGDHHTTLPVPLILVLRAKDVQCSWFEY
jgi:hypothetical protein